MFPKKNKTINKWAAVIATIFLLLFCLLIGRFVYIANGKEIDGHQLVNIGENQWKTVKVVDAHRGSIYGRNDHVLAHDIPAYTIYAVISPKAGKGNYVKNKEKTAKLLAPILDMKESKILDLLNKNLQNKNTWQVEFGTSGKKLSYDKKKKIDKLKLPGIKFKQETKRYYPNQKFASYVLGFTQYDQEKKKAVGKLGVERSLNDYLTEQDGKVTFKTSQEGVKMPDAKKHLKKPKQGDNVYLTIDNKIQTVLGEAMSSVAKEYKPKRMIGVVADPKTGQILAMSNRPSFNPNKRDIENYTNFAVSSPYEPGSVMKMFTLASAIDAGVYNGNATFQSGSYDVGGITVHDWNQSWGRISFNEGLQRSSNVGFSIIADKQLGTDRFYDYLKKFGFTQKTGIDLPKESNSRMSFKWKADQVSTAFGQASAFTSLQLVQAATAIANDGKMMRPYVIEKVKNPTTGKVVLNHKPKVAGTPISKETAEKTRKLLRTVVHGKHGTGKPYDLKGYDVIGKTGTAQIAVNGNYLTGRNNYIFSFMGMAPEKDPKLIVYVAVDRPHLKDTETGSEPVAKVFNPVMSNALQYLNIKPEKKADKKQTTSEQTVTLKQYKGEPFDEAAKDLKAKGVDVVTVGKKGKVTKQAPFDGTKVLKGSKVILVGEGKLELPDLTGWSLSDSLKVANLLSLKPNIIGNGFVIDQKPAKGTVVKKGDYLVLNLQAEDNKNKEKQGDAQDKKKSSQMD
ncbi:penicillin-binding protein 2B [Scopulibacillus darangshiensis]|uniref:Penicillin-binding protein 2B n=1 Tax=Scopulibacillus darangshiensis TaxID=442528 RepID=A0A4R2P5M3_9BACL|nr:penicillin-binding protein 2 [Scopulibacillus darangshiensis]TCP29085.1 penicillin-binding protein 2B [Scopulibacillus darangshiensis]